MGKGVVKLGDGNWAVKDGNLLAVKETNGRFKNTEFTVERGTRATYVGRDGLIKESDLQNTNLVLNGDFEELGSNLITNGDFSTAGALTNSSYSLGWTSPDSGLSISSGVLNITRLSNGGRAYASNGSSGNLTITSGKTYQLTYTITENTDNSTLAYHTGAAYVNTSSSVPGTYTVTYVAAGTIFLFRNNDIDTTIKIDNVTLKQVDPNDRWTAGAGWSIEDGKAVASPATDYLYQDNVYDHTTVKTYKITYDITVDSGTFKFLILGKTGSSFFGNQTTSDTYTIYFTTTGSSGDGRLYIANQGNFDGDVNSVSVKEVDPNNRWTLGDGWKIEDGKAVCDGSQSGNADITHSNLITEKGVQYEITYTVSNYSAGTIKTRLSSGNTTAEQSSNGTFTEIITAAGAGGFRLRGNSTFVGSVDNVSVKEYAIQPLDI